MATYHCVLVYTAVQQYVRVDYCHFHLAYRAGTAVGPCYDDWLGIPPTLGNDLGVEYGFVESPFWHSLVRGEFTVCWSHTDSELSSPKDERRKVKERSHGAHSTKRPSKVTNNYYA